MVRRLIVALVAAFALLAGTLAGPPAQASISTASVKNLPCRVPSGNIPYCANPAWRVYAYQAFVYSNTMGKTTRVPFPSRNSRSAKKYKNEYYVVYVVRSKAVWEKGAPNDIRKFGETRQANWKDRANESRRQCDKPATTCDVTWVLATKGYYNARYMEASLIQKYRLRHGFCPPGQPISCR